MPTHIAHKMDSEAKLKAGLAFGRSVFVPSDERGLPLSTSIPVKINLKTFGAGKFRSSSQSILPVHGFSIYPNSSLMVWDLLYAARICREFWHGLSAGFADVSMMI